MIGPYRETLLQDVRFASRQLLRRPAATVAAVLTLAVGTGVGVTAVAAVRALFLQPLPFARASELVVGWAQERRGAKPVVQLSYPAIRQMARDNPGVAGLAGVPQAALEGSLRRGTETVAVRAVPVTGGFFEVLGARASVGRALEPTDDVLGHAPVAVLSHALWVSQFGRDPGVVGRRVDVNDQPVTVVGVMPPGFDFPHRAQVWTPLATTLPEMVDDWRVGFLVFVARLSPGQSAEGGRARLGAYLRQLSAREPFVGADDVQLVPMRRYLLGDWRPAVLALAGAGALVLLVAGTNVTSLLLVRAAAREREIAIRTALGAPRRRLVRQLLTEGVVLAAVALPAGLALAAPAIWLLRQLLSLELTQAEQLRLDWGVAAAAGGVVLAMVVVATVPAVVRLTRVARTASLRSDARSGSGRAAVRALDGLVAAQVAFATVLLVGAALLGRSFLELQRVDLGFDARRLLSARVDLPARPGEPAAEQAVRQNAVIDALLPAVRAERGVVGAAAVLLPPLEGRSGFDFPFRLAGQDSATAARNPLVNYQAVTSDYLRTLRIPLLRGREFTPQDRERAPLVVVVSAAFARRFWPGKDPIGQGIQLPPYREWRTVVGVAGAARYRDVRESSLDVYVPYRQSPFAPGFVVVRTAGDPARMAGPLRGAVRRAAPGAELARVRTFEEQFAAELARPRYTAHVLLGLAAAALVLAALGVYGALSFAVSQRVREIGVRMALGADAGRVRRDVVGKALRLVALGLLVALLPALAGAQALAHLLFVVTSYDVATYALVALILLATSLAASYLPARRATRVAPSVALRSEW